MPEPSEQLLWFDPTDLVKDFPKVTIPPYSIYKEIASIVHKFTSIPRSNILIGEADLPAGDSLYSAVYLVTSERTAEHKIKEEIVTATHRLYTENNEYLDKLYVAIAQQRKDTYNVQFFRDQLIETDYSLIGEEIDLSQVLLLLKTISISIGSNPIKLNIQNLTDTANDLIDIDINISAYQNDKLYPNTVAALEQLAKVIESSFRGVRLPGEGGSMIKPLENVRVDFIRETNKIVFYNMPSQYTNIQASVTPSEGEGGAGGQVGIGLGQAANIGFLNAIGYGMKENIQYVEPGRLSFYDIGMMFHSLLSSTTITSSFFTAKEITITDISPLTVVNRIVAERWEQRTAVQFCIEYQNVIELLLNNQEIGDIHIKGRSSQDTISYEEDV